MAQFLATIAIAAAAGFIGGALFISLINQQWSDLQRFFSSPFAKFTSLVPIVGYFIIFNDAVLGFVSFSTITGDRATIFSDRRFSLYFLYYGLLSISFASLAYQVCCPRWVKRVESRIEFHDAIERIVGSYYVDWLMEWANKVGFHSEDHEKSAKILKKDLEKLPHNDAIQKNRDFLNDLLESAYIALNGSRRLVRIMISALVSLSVAILLVPSIDLFVGVTNEAYNIGVFDPRIWFKGSPQ